MTSIPLQAGTANCSSPGPQKISSSIAASLPHQSNMGLIRDDCYSCEDLFKYGSEQAVKEKASLRPFAPTQRAHLYIGMDRGGFRRPHRGYPLLVLPAQLGAIFSFHVAAIGLWMLSRMRLRFGFTSVTWSDLVPSPVDACFWAIALLMGVTGWLTQYSNDQTESQNSD